MSRASLEVLAILPDDMQVTVTLSVAELRRALERDNPDRDLSTSEASEEFGHSIEWWSRRAERVPGAWQEGEGAPWNLPRRGCRAYLAGLRSQGRRKSRKGLRGPRQANAPTERARAANLPPRSLLRRGPEAVEGGTADAQKPSGPRLAS